MTRSRTFLWAAHLLRYPDEELQALARHARQAAAPADTATQAGSSDPGISDKPENLETLDLASAPAWAVAFLEHVSVTPLLDMQADFVRTFDLNPAASLYLTTHAYGDSPLQGRALAALTELYRDSGCTPVGGELPDCLPLMLEFLALAPSWAAACLCEKFAPVVRGISTHLATEDSPWANLMQAVVQTMLECVPVAGAEPAPPDAIRPAAEDYPGKAPGISSREVSI